MLSLIRCAGLLTTGESLRAERRHNNWGEAGESMELWEFRFQDEFLDRRYSQMDTVGAGNSTICNSGQLANPYYA